MFPRGTGSQCSTVQINVVRVAILGDRFRPHWGLPPDYGYIISHVIRNLSIHIYHIKVKLLC